MFLSPSSARALQLDLSEVFTAFPKTRHAHCWAVRQGQALVHPGRHSPRGQGAIAPGALRRLSLKILTPCFVPTPGRSGARSSPVTSSAAAGKGTGGAFLRKPQTPLLLSRELPLCSGGRGRQLGGKACVLGGGLAKKRPLVSWPTTVGGVARKTGSRSSATAAAEASSRWQRASQPEGAPESWRPSPCARGASRKQGPRNMV